ncbi:MAG: GMC family oxidoreductase [Rhodospirillaceae bacterium]|nr:GMC family oxidoreductase [Rhodospirillaceae bacterium]MCA8932428.1 GMC family oxidoreductase [Rhodospirillaceae bacterium]
MSTDRYDVIIVGSGAGGAATAYRLARAGKRVLMLEKGRRLPCDGSTLDVKQVFAEGRFKNKEPWRDGRGGSLVPEEYYNVGGKTKWYGAALLRFSAHEFEADPEHQCLAWPFGLDVLAPYYDEAESLLHVNRFANEPELQRLVERVTQSDAGWRSEALPLGLKPEILNDEREAKHFDGYASVAGYKADAEHNLLDEIADLPNFTLMARRKVIGLMHRRGSPEVVEGVICRDGSYFTADKVVLAAGAMTSPRILQDHLDATGVGETLPSAPLVGANFKLHINSALVAFSPFAHNDVLRKTAIFLNERYPHTTVQCLGWLDGDILATQLPRAVPKFVANAIGARAIGFFITTEDGSSPANRIVSGGGEEGTPTADYDLDRLPPAKAEHAAAIGDFTRRLLRAGLAGVDRYAGLAGSAHALGSLVAGDDPAASVVDADGKVHGMDGLYVGDGSVLPRSSRVNPALTIYAWGLRLGEHLAH